MFKTKIPAAALTVMWSEAVWSKSGRAGRENEEEEKMSITDI